MRSYPFITTTYAESGVEVSTVLIHHESYGATPETFAYETAVIRRHADRPVTIVSTGMPNESDARSAHIMATDVLEAAGMRQSSCDYADDDNRVHGICSGAYCAGCPDCRY